MRASAPASTLAALFALALLAACARERGAPRYQSEIRWTSYGIPHVKAGDWGSLGYGFAYATATDGVCVIARDVAMVNGELSAHFGPGDGNVESDVFHKSIITDGKLARVTAALDGGMREYAAGYVAGYNRYLEEHAGRLPASCAGASWLRPITAADVARQQVGLAIRYGVGQFQDDIAHAAPPGEAAARGETRFDLPPGIGSNAIALGKAATESGRGMLFGNPHYPWHGPSRFHVIHTTIPGELDSMGASLLVTSFVAIGFNKDIAWTHTVSTALRYTLYELELNPANPLEYRYGAEYRPIEPIPVSVRVRGDDGAMSSLERTVYLTHYGPVVVSEQLPWTTAKAYAIRDAVIDNDASTATYTALNTATSIDEVEAAISLQGVYWTNTIAADREGNAFYADISGTPNIDAAMLEQCRVAAAGIPERVVVLNGARPACEWKADPRSRVPGTLPAGEMPRIRRDDYVTNSNDSYWLANPLAPLEGYSPIIGEERSERSLRTRAGLTLLQEALAADGRLEPADVQAMLYSHRNHGAELLLDDILKICGDVDPVVPVDGADIDIGASCTVLAGWDRTANVGSRGVQLWTEFWRTANRIDGLYAVPFDPADPVHTPRGIAVDDAEVVDALKEALARGQKTLGDAGIPLDAPWGEVQFAQRNGEDIPIPGAPGWSGMFSYIVAGLNKGQGYTPIIAGNSYIQVVSWDAAGELDARGMLTYSQSPEADSPHYADLTRLYSRGEWIRLPFTEEEILADPNLRTLTLSGN